MPEIKLKHVVSFSSEDKVYKAENMLNAETYRKWKCSSIGEKNASIVLQFEKATQIHSIDIGNESSAFVEVLVGRSSDTVSSYQVLLVASSFMSPAESRNGTNLNRVRMFGPEKLAQNIKDEKWDCVQVVCSQPFNKNTTYGLSFIKFHSPPETQPQPSIGNEAKKNAVQLGAFKLKDEEDEFSPPLFGSWLERKNIKSANLDSSSSQDSPSYAAVVLASDSSPNNALKNFKIPKRRLDESEKNSNLPPSKKDSLFQPVIKPKPVQISLQSKPVQSSSFPKIQPKESPRAKQHDTQSPSSSKPNGRIIASKKDIPTTPTTSRKQENHVNKPNKVKKSFENTLEGVVFTISGFVNPLRSQIRDKALELGAKYKGDWDKSCTHLICAFINTPKYTQVCQENGKIVTKDWILDCYKQRKLLPWKKYILGKNSRDSTSSESSDIDDDLTENANIQKTSPKGNSRSEGQWTITTRVPSAKESPLGRGAPSDDDETDDEDAIQDYLADTDSDSGGDTEDEIRKVEEQAKKKVAPSFQVKRKGVVFEEDADDSPPEVKPDTSDLPLPPLPNIFKQKHFFLYGKFSDTKRHDLERYISAYDGVLDDYMSDQIKYIVTESKWDENFDQAVCEYDELVFVRPTWIFKCHESEKFVPYQPYIVIPD